MPEPEDPTVIDDTDAEREMRRVLDEVAEQQARGVKPTKAQLVSAARALREGYI
jgi:hypothetical protein